MSTILLYPLRCIGQLFTSVSVNSGGYLANSSHYCLHTYVVKFLKQLYRTQSASHPLIVCKLNILNTSWVHLSLKSERYTNFWIPSCQISLFLWYCLAWRLRLLEKRSSSVTLTKQGSILFCSEVNSAGYFEIEEPIRLCKKHYSPARYMLNANLGRSWMFLSRRFLVKSYLGNIARKQYFSNNVSSSAQGLNR